MSKEERKERKNEKGKKKYRRCERSGVHMGLTIRANVLRTKRRKEKSMATC
jgi:hypothetical protein